LAIISLKCLRSIKKIAEISYRTGASSAVSQSPQFCFGLCVTENKQRPEFIFCIRKCHQECKIKHSWSSKGARSGEM